jgi:hypothetical protein
MRNKYFHTGFLHCYLYGDRINGANERIATNFSTASKPSTIFDGSLLEPVMVLKGD